MRFKKIYIEITNICNMQCSFCPPTNRLKKEMSVEQFEQVLKQIKPFTSYVYLHLRGEPLLHSHFSEILKLCEKYNIKVNITTNGYFLKKYINIIKDSLIINQINISLHAYDSENEIIELIEVIENIRNNQANIVIRHWVSDKKDKSFLMLNDILNNKYSVEILDSKNVKLDNKLFFNIDKEFTWPDRKSVV